MPACLYLTLTHPVKLWHGLEGGPFLPLLLWSCDTVLSPNLLELRVAKVHDGPHYFIATVLLLRSEAQTVHCIRRRGQAEREFRGQRVRRVNIVNRVEQRSLVEKGSHLWPTVPPRQLRSPLLSHPGSKSGSGGDWWTSITCMEDQQEALSKA